MYIALRPPWRGGGAATAPIDAGPDIVAVHPDAGVAKKKPHRHRSPTPNQPVGSDDQGGDDPGPPELVLTAADRALAWAGDGNMALPPVKMDASSGSEPRKLDDGEINGGLAPATGALQGCLQTGAANTDLKATITLELVVDGTGHVTKSRIQAPSYLQSHGLLECARRAIGRMKFPATGAATLVTLPMTLG